MSDVTIPIEKKSLLPQEERLEVTQRKGRLVIGIPRETHYQENRVALSPNTVATMVAQGHEFIIETNAGKNAHFSDKEYAEAGAKIVENPKEVFDCPMIIKVEPPSLDEIKLMKKGTLFFSALQLKTQEKKYIDALISKKITAVAYDFIQDNNGVFPIVKSLSEIAGTASVLIASELLSSTKSKGLLFGNISGVKPIEVVVIGAGTVAEGAIRSAMGLGASVKVFDNSVPKLQELQHRLGTYLHTCTIQPKELLKALKTCDVAIGAVRGELRSPIIVTEEMVKQMKENAVIIDVSIDRGGCFETSEVTNHKMPTIKKYGVIHYGVPNIPSKYPKTASLSISNILTPYLLDIAHKGGFENAVRTTPELQKGLYLYKGILTHKTVANWFDIPFRDTNLLFL